MSDARNRFGFGSENFGNEPDPSRNVKPMPQTIQLDGSFFVDLGCATWRLHQRMFDKETGEARDEFRQLARHVATIRDRLSELGLQIQDHTGKRLTGGLGMTWFEVCASKL